MKRDMDLIRSLILFFEQKEGPEMVEIPPIEGYSESQIKYHLILMYQAGFISAEPVRSSTSDRIIYVLPFELTWDGHEFAQMIESDSRWQKAKQEVLGRVGTLTFEGLKAWLRYQMNERLGVPVE